MSRDHNRPRNTTRRRAAVVRWEDLAAELVHVVASHDDRSRTFCGLAVGTLAAGRRYLLTAGARITCATCAGAPHAADYTAADVRP